MISVRVVPPAFAVTAVLVQVVTVPAAAEATFVGSADGGSAMAGQTVVVELTVGKSTNPTAIGPIRRVATFPDGWSVERTPGERGTFRNASNT